MLASYLVLISSKKLHPSQGLAHTGNFWEGVHTPCSWLERITKDTCICYTVLQEEIEARPETEVQWSNLCNFECEGPGWNVRAKGLSKEWRVSWAVARWQWAVAVAHGRWHAHFPCPGIQVACHVVSYSSSWCVGREESNEIWSKVTSRYALT